MNAIFSAVILRKIRAEIISNKFDVQTCIYTNKRYICTAFKANMFRTCSLIG